MSPLITRAAVCLATTLLLTVPLAANAQVKHIGNGQALNVQADLLNLVDVGVASQLAGNQPAAGGNYSVGPEAVVSNVSALGLNVGTLVSGVNNFVSVNASALSATSNGGGGQVTSTATVGTLGATNPTTSLTLGLSVPGVISLDPIPAVSLSNFLTLKALRTETFANVAQLKTSRTIIEGLAIRNGNGSFVNIASSAAGSGATITTNLDGTFNLDFDNSDSTVQILIGGVGQGNLASVFLHEKLNNVDGSRTTNGIHVDLLDAGLTGLLGDVDVKIASSTAGVSAPEPGSLSLLALTLGGGIAVRVRRRSKGTGIMHSKA